MNIRYALMCGLAAAATCAGYFGLTARSATNERAKPTGIIRPQDLADALHAVIAADREVYTRVIVHRLQNEEKLIRASARWETEKTLPVPSQMLRLGAEAVQSRGAEFSYTLRSLWAINPKNAPETEVEKRGLEFVASHPGQNYYTPENLGGRRYLTAVYADVASHAACVSCHNARETGSKREFKQGDVMGGIVVRVALEF